LIPNKVQAGQKPIMPMTDAIVPTTDAIPVPTGGNLAKAPIPSNAIPTTFRIGRSTPLHGMS